MARKNICYDWPLENTIGFSRAVRIGNFIAVTATAPIEERKSGETPGNVYGQSLRCLSIIDDVIKKAGAKRSDVIRTRVFLKDIKTWEDAARAHHEYFSEIKPACSFIGVSGFINQDWLVEIEADLIVGRKGRK